MKKLCIALICGIGLFNGGCVFDDVMEQAGYVPTEQCCPCLGEIIGNVLDRALKGFPLIEDADWDGVDPPSPGPWPSVGDDPDIIGTDV